MQKEQSTAGSAESEHQPLSFRILQLIDVPCSWSFRRMNLASLFGSGSIPLRKTRKASNRIVTMHRPVSNGASKKTAVVIVDHGSRRAEANALLHDVVESFRSRSQMSIVQAAHMEIQKPNIADALCSHKCLIVKCSWMFCRCLC